MNLQGRQNLGGLGRPPKVNKIFKFFENFFDVVLGQNAPFKHLRLEKIQKKFFSKHPILEHMSRYIEY